MHARLAVRYVSKTHFDRGTLYGERWYLMRVDRAYLEVVVDEIGCSFWSTKWSQGSQNAMAWESVS